MSVEPYTMRTGKSPEALASELALPILLVLMQAARLSFIRTGPSQSQARISPNATTVSSVQCGCLPTWFATTLVLSDVFYRKLVQPVLEFEGHNPDNPINRASLCYDRGQLWLERIRAMVEDLARSCFGPSCPEPASSTVDPLAQIAGLVVHYSAEDLSSSPVARWENRRGCLHPAVQQDVATRPAYEPNGLAGLPTVRFNGVDQFMTIPLGRLGITTLVVVGALQGGGVAFSAEGRIPPFRGKSLEVSGGNLSTLQQGVALAGSTVDKPSVLVLRESPTSITAWVKAATQVLYTGTPEAWDPAALLGGESPPLLAQLGRRVGGAYLTGSISELLLFDRALSDLEVSEVQAHLSSKWNLQ